MSANHKSNPTRSGFDATLIDNKSHGIVADALRDSLVSGASLSLLSSKISLHAFIAMRAEIEGLSNARILVPGVPANGQLEEWRMQAISLLGDVADRRSRNSLECPAAARAFTSWLHSTAQLKSASVPIPQNLFHVEHAKGSLAIQGSSTFTSGGLGLAPSAGYDMNTCFKGEQEAGSLLAWFDSIWSNEAAAAPCDEIILAWLEEIASMKPAELVYFVSLYNLFRDTLSDLEEDQIIKTRTGICETLVWNKLYRFQRDGVLGAIDKIEKYNGCIIADSVGLGKTFEALAIIKYYELRNDRVLVLCPKKLRENWTIFTVNDRRNLFDADRFNYDVLNHTDLSRTTGRSGEINLETINWGNYDLVVIDESHNFRNNPSRQDRPTRYSRLMTEIIRAGVRTKVLMLSATPVNSRMNDLKNQVAFITEGRDDALFNRGIPSIEQTLRQAQTRFNAWLKRDADDRTTRSLLNALTFDYFKMLDLLTIARSRKHIMKYYDTADIGDFPERAKPVNIKANIDTRDQFPELREINREIRRLNLSAYAPLKYVLPHKLEEYSRRYDKQISGGSVFRQIDREQSLIHLMRVNLLKRMESSINSFAITVERLLSEVQSFMARLDAHQGEEVEELNIEDVDIDDDDLDPYLIGSKVKVLIQDVDQVRWRQELEEDEELLVKMLREARRIDAERDAKLHELKSMLRCKIDHPLNPGNRKAIIFTAFADTAEYLYNNIADWAKADLEVHSALVTGRSNSNKTTLAGIRKDLSSIITSFSPISKERAKINEELTDEIDILIATDCISEGQNLQDCDYLVNYDIHWNPVRIIQRFGRIDRLGSQNSVIQLVNFWPNMELDEYINLEARVSGRMVLLDISATGEENIIEQTDADQMNDLEYRRRQFEQMQDEVIDMEDLSNGISITDLTLNDFRMDLVEYLKEHANRLEYMPLGAYGVATTDDLIDIDDAGPGVLWCLRAENTRVRTDSSYALAPHYLVYVSEEGEVRLNFSDTKQILDLFKKVSLGCSQLDDAAMAVFNERTENGTDMAQYQGQLGKAIAAITGKAEEQGVQSLFTRGGTAITKDSFQGIDDFEVVAYLVIVDTGAQG